MLAAKEKLRFAERSPPFAELACANGRAVLEAFIRKQAQNATWFFIFGGSNFQ
jgi:hypothetical protein